MCSKYARVCNIYKRYVTPGHFINFSTEFLIDGLYGLRKFFVFNSKDPRLQIHVEVYDAIVPILNFETLEFGCFQVPDSMVVPTVTMLFFFWDFFWRSGLFEYWTRSHVRAHCFGCSLQPGTPFQSFQNHWPYRFRRDNRCSSTNARRRIPAFLPTVIKLVCV